MGDAKRKQIAIQNNPVLAQPTLPNIGLTDKFLTYLGPRYDCVVEKVIQEYAMYFEQKGYATIFVPENRMKEVIDFAPKVLVLFRTGTHPGTPPSVIQEVEQLINHLKLYNVRIVYYMDDFLFLINHAAPLRLASLSDAIIVATPNLKDWLADKRIVPSIHVVPTHINLPFLDTLEPVDFIKNNPKFKVLFTSGGRVGTMILHDLLEYISTTEGMAAKFDDVEFIINANGVAQIRTIVNRFRNIHKSYYDFFISKDFYRLCQSANMIIAPASTNDIDYLVPPELQKDWLDSKSEVKFTIAGAFRLPIVASTTRAYRESIKHGVNGFLTDDPKEYADYILQLKDNKGLREKLGGNARRDVENIYDIRKRSESMLSAILGLTKETVSYIPEEVSDISKIYLPPLAGGPRTFFNTMSKYIPIVTNDKWAITDQLTRGVRAAIIVAFYGIQEAKSLKSVNPKAKVILRVDGLPMNFDGTYNPQQFKLMQETMDWVDLIVWQSQHCKNMWKAQGANVDRGVIIHNGVDLTIFTPNGLKTELAFGKINLLHTNFSTFKHKRIDILTDMITAAPEGYHFNLVGHYKDTTVTNDIKSWEPYKNVSYYGPILDQGDKGRERLACMYRGADALIFTSEMEGSPNSVLEATGCTTPIIYNANADIVPEILADNAMGVKDDNEFKAALEQLKSEIFIQGLKNNLLDFREKYSAEIMARNWMQVIDG